MWNSENYDINKFGLKYVPDIGEDNDKDFLHSYLPDGPLNIGVEFSPGNVEVLKNEILKLGDNCKVIFEIGCKGWVEDNSTDTIKKNKLKTTKHICLDFNCDNLAGLENPEENRFKICEDSSKQNNVRDFLVSKGIGVGEGLETIDLLFIDGNHSVDFVLNDFMYTDLLSPGGVVVMHDSNDHPGPVELLKALDENVWNIQKYCTNRNNDWGITVIKRK